MYAPEAPNGTAVIYAAGGGYIRVAVGTNGGEITRWLNRIGITVFVLKYRHADYGQPAPLQDALRAVRVIRSRAEELGVKADRIGLLGGSAGGHLAASAGSMFEAPEGRTGASLDAVSSTVPAGTYQAQETRMVMDGSIEYRFDRRFAFYASVRNLANEPRPLITVSPNAPAYTQPRSYTYYGALWTIGVKGTF